jgi:hypothetical protein
MSTHRVNEFKLIDDEENEFTIFEYQEGIDTEDQVCRADSPDSGVPRVKITVRHIDSRFGLCTILSTKRVGATFALHVECEGSGGSRMMGDINFTPRDDKTFDFWDQDGAYTATLYKCPD